MGPDIGDRSTVAPYSTAYGSLAPGGAVGGTGGYWSAYCLLRLARHYCGSLALCTRLTTAGGASHAPLSSLIE